MSQEKLFTDEYHNLVDEFLKTKDSTKLKSYIDETVNEAGVPGIDAIITEVMKRVDAQLINVKSNPQFEQQLAMNMLCLMIDAQKEDRDGFDTISMSNIDEAKFVSTMMKINDQLMSMPDKIKTDGEIRAILSHIGSIYNCLRLQYNVLVWCGQKIKNESRAKAVKYPDELRKFRNTEYHNNVIPNITDETVFLEDKGPPYWSETYTFQQVWEKFDLAMAYFSAFTLAQLLATVHKMLQSAAFIKMKSAQVHGQLQ